MRITQNKKTKTTLPPIKRNYTHRLNTTNKVYSHQIGLGRRNYTHGYCITDRLYYCPGKCEVQQVNGMVTCQCV
jgi:hypothetical protein